jgi:hypothetical protein
VRAFLIYKRKDKKMKSKRKIKRMKIRKKIEILEQSGKNPKAIKRLKRKLKNKRRIRDWRKKLHIVSGSFEMGKRK